ncbi:MAG: DUF5063 domain-containing protein [Bacteroidales bacterium]
MSSRDIDSFIYSTDVLEFITIAAEYCKCIEAAETVNQETFVRHTQRLLPLLYIKGSLLKRSDTEEENIAHYLTEHEYYALQASLERVLGEHDRFTDINSEYQEGVEPYIASISEYLMDIYQDMKDFVHEYREGNDLVMELSINRCIDAFEHYWGKKTVSVLRPIHSLSFLDATNNSSIFDTLNNTAEENEEWDDFMQQFRK